MDQRPVDQAPAPRRLLESPRFALVKLREGYDMEEVDDFVDRVLATVNGTPIDRPVTAREISTKQFSTVRIREGYDVMEVDLFLEEAEGCSGAQCDDRGVKILSIQSAVAYRARGQLGCRLSASAHRGGGAAGLHGELLEPHRVRRVARAADQPGRRT